MEAGLDPDAFWRLTPWQTRLAVQGAHGRMITLAWYVAALGRQHTLPKLDALLGRQPQRAKMSPAEMRGVLVNASQARK